MSIDVEEPRIVGARVATPETDPLLTFTPGRLTLVYRLSQATTAVWAHIFREEVTQALVALVPHTVQWTWQIVPFRDLFSFNIPFGPGTVALLDQLTEVLGRALAATNRDYGRYRQEEHPSAIYVREEAWGEGLRRNEEAIVAQAKDIDALLARQFPTLPTMRRRADPAGAGRSDRGATADGEQMGNRGGDAAADGYPRARRGPGG